MARVTRIRLVIAAGVLAFVLFIGLPYSHRHYFQDFGSSVTGIGKPWDNANTETDAQNVVAGTSELSTRYCEGDSCFKGSWKPRKPPYKSIDELKPWKGCPSTQRGAGVMTEAEERAASEKRLVDLMNWAWKPKGGILKDWDPEAFVVRLLRSPGGLVSVGDSTAKEHFEALMVSLQQGGIPLQLESNSSPQFKHKYVQQYVLNSDDSITKTLSERAGVPQARLARPILTMIQDSLLINDMDLRTISQRLGTKKGATWKTTLPRVARWPSLVEDIASPSDDGDRESIPEDTILLLNTGNHWSRVELTILKSRDNPMAEQNYLTEAYRQMLRVISDTLKPISRLTIYYRATTPGHPKCYSRSSPYKTAVMAEALEKNVISRLLQGVSTEDDRMEKRRRDWDLFNVHNDLWRRAIVRLEQEREQACKKPYPFTKVFAKWRYLDVWNQALQRPDAHRDPLQNCLTWCSPVLFDQWTLHLNHILQLETDKNEDKPGISNEEDSDSK